MSDSKKRKTSKKMRLTQEIIDRAQCPKDEARFFLWDSDVPGFGVRMSPGGAKTYILKTRVRESGRIIQKTLSRVSDINLRAARDKARAEITQEREKAEAIANGEPVDDDITIDEAFEETLAASRRGERSKRDWRYEVGRFKDWLKKSYPQVTLWKSLNRRILEKYMLTFANKAPNTRRLRVVPIVQTSRRMHTVYGTARFADDLRIGNTPVRPPARVYVKDVLSFLGYVREHEPRLEAGAALQALAGLRASEAFRLTWGRVDLARGLIEVSGEIKNTWSERVIPVCGRVIEALKRTQALQQDEKIKDLSGGFVVRSKQGADYTGQSFYNYGAEMTTLIREWHSAKAKELERELPPIDWTCKDLRNCLPTLAMQKRLSGAAVWESYIGHSPQDVTARHYLPRLTMPTEGARDAMNEEMQTLKRLVVDVIEQAIQDASKPPQEAKIIEAGNGKEGNA